MHLLCLFFTYSATFDIKPKKEILYIHKLLCYMEFSNNKMYIQTTTAYDTNQETAEKTKELFKKTFDKFTNHYEKKIMLIISRYIETKYLAEYENEKAIIIEEYQAFMGIYIGALIYQVLRFINLPFEQYAYHFSTAILRCHVNTIKLICDTEEIENALSQWSVRSESFSEGFVEIYRPKILSSIKHIKEAIFSKIIFDKFVITLYDIEGKFSKIYTDNEIIIALKPLVSSKPEILGARYNNTGHNDVADRRPNEQIANIKNVDHKKILELFADVAVLFSKDFKETKDDINKALSNLMDCCNKKKVVCDDGYLSEKFKDNIKPVESYILKFKSLQSELQRFCIGMEEYAITIFDDAYVGFKNTIDTLHVEWHIVLDYYKDYKSEFGSTTVRIAEKDVELIIFKVRTLYDMILSLTTRSKKTYKCVTDWVNLNNQNGKLMMYPRNVTFSKVQSYDKSVVETHTNQNQVLATTNNLFYGLYHIYNTNSIQLRLIESANVLHMLEKAIDSDVNQYESLLKLYRDGDMKMSDEFVENNEANIKVLKKMTNVIGQFFAESKTKENEKITKQLDEILAKAIIPKSMEVVKD